MPKYIIDSYAWVEYFIASDKGKQVKEIIESNKNEIFTSVIVIAEVMSISKRENMDAEQAYNTILGLSKIHYFDEKFAKELGILHSEIRKKIKDFGMVDCLLLLTARKLGAKVVTGDPHFKDFKDVIFIG